MAVAGNTLTASFLTKIVKMQSAVCWLCRIARDESTDGLAAETHGHINSAGCKGMATTGCPPLHLEAPMTACTLHKSQKASSSLSRLTRKVT